MREVSFKEAMRRKYPERVVLVTSYDQSKARTNIIPLGWFMNTSFEPPLIAISVGLTRYSHKLIKETREFGIGFPNPRMGEDILFCGTHSGREVDKFAQTKFSPFPSRYIKAPLIKGCVISCECKLVSELLTGDHTIFVGEVLAAYQEESEKKILLNFGNYKFGSI